MTPSIHNVFSVSISGALATTPGGMECMHTCPHFVHLGVAVDSNALLYVFSIFIAYRFEVVFTLQTGRTFCQATEGLWKTRALGGRDMGIPPFKMPTLNRETLWAEDSMRDEYHPKMLLYALDELFYVYAQVKNSGRVDDKLVLAYEILCIPTNHCTDRRNGIEKTSVPDALALINVNDVRHLECLAWAVYDGILLVGPWPELSGDHSWCTVLAGLHQHIYRGHDDAAHCPPQTLGFWDCQE